MKISKILASIVLTILTSFYFFPFEFTFLPGVNTKMMMAVGGLVFLAFEFAKKRELKLKDDFIWINVIAIAIGVVSMTAMAVNNSPDDSYATYIVSVWVWASGAYAVIYLIKMIHGGVTARIVCNYLIAVCVFQITIAFSMQFLPWLKDFVDSFLYGTGFMGKNEDRLYGIGCALDPAGIRFAAVLVIICWQIINTDKSKKITIVILLLAYTYVLVFGNFMTRSTILGIPATVLLLTLRRQNNNETNSFGRKGFVTLFLISVAIMVPIMVHLYNENYTVHENLRFGFEGFFAIAEDGYWHTNSNDALLSMIRFPESLKTWIIGDGRAASTLTDDNYIGHDYEGYYMGIDIGYLRFIYYFGMIGTILMMVFFISLTICGCRRNPHLKPMLACILVINLVGWFKVTSDLIMVLLPFICFSEYDGIPEDSTEGTGCE